ncbi:hypothetical protein ES707_16714 [subsurface metagenome]
MQEWEKVDFFADGVIYTCGNKRKIVTSGTIAIYDEIKGQQVWRYRPTSIRNPSRQKNNRPEAKFCRKSQWL